MTRATPSRSVGVLSFLLGVGSDVNARSEDEDWCAPKILLRAPQLQQAPRYFIMPKRSIMTCAIASPTPRARRHAFDAQDNGASLRREWRKRSDIRGCTHSAAYGRGARRGRCTRRGPSQLSGPNCPTKNAATLTRRSRRPPQARALWTYCGTEILRWSACWAPCRYVRL